MFDRHRLRRAVATLAALAALATAPMAVLAPADAESAGDAGATAYVVAPGDTLWTIAQARYDGVDPREAVWRIRERNALADPTVVPGQRLVLP